MNRILLILIVFLSGLLAPDGAALEARTRVIGIDGGMDPTPERTDNDEANTNLIRSLIEAFRRHRPATEDQMVDSYDALDALLENFTCECGDTIFFVFSGHGHRVGIAFSKEEDEGNRLYDYSEIARKLRRADKECCCKIYFLIEACYSGSALDHLFADEHVKGVYTSTTRDTFSTYTRDSIQVTGGWLRRIIEELDDIRHKVGGEDFAEDLDEALKKALGKAKDRTPVGAWHDGEQPQAFRRDTTVIYGHVREMFKNRFDLLHMVVEVHDPYWRRGQLDTIFLEDDEDFEKFRKCKWVKTEIVYEDLYGDRPQTGPITEAENVKDQLITAHVMRVEKGKVQVHVSWPRNMYCREIWIDNPEEVYEPPDIKMPELPKPKNKANREEYKRIEDEIKRIKKYLEQHKREWRKNARHRRISECRWIQQEVDILDPNGAAKAKKKLKPFGRYVSDHLMHVKSVNRRTGHIVIGNRKSWIDRYKYNKIKVPDSLFRHLDTLNKDKRGRPRKLERCDNIWAEIWIPGSRDSMPTLVDASVVEKVEGRSTRQTRLSKPATHLVGHRGMVIPEVYIINNDEMAYDALVHVSVFEYGGSTIQQVDQLNSLQRLIGGTRSREDTDFNDSEVGFAIRPPEECNQFLDQLQTNHKALFDNLEAEIYDLLRANYLMHYLNLKGENSFGRYPHLDNYTQRMAALQPVTVAGLEPESFRNQPLNEPSARIALGYPQTRRFPNMRTFSLAYHQSTIACAEDQLGAELEVLWSDALQQSDDVLKQIETERNQLETRVQTLLNQRFSDISEFDIELNVDCNEKLANYIARIASSNPELYLNKVPVFTRSGLHQSMHIENNDFEPSNLDHTHTQALLVSQQVIEVATLNPGEEKLVRFDPQNLSPGKLYTAYFWRADRPDPIDNEATVNWSYEAQDTLSVQFFIRKEDKCQCPDDALSIEAIATGEMTGEVYQLKVKNQSDNTVLCRIGPYLSPGNGSRQSIYMPERMEISLLPEESINLTLNGYCLDHHLPPPTKGTIEYPNSEWIELNSSNRIAQFENQLELPRTAKPIQIESANKNLTLTMPGHDEPLRWEPKTTHKLSGTFHDEYFTKLALINDQVWALTEKSISDMYYNDELSTPLGNSGSDQRILLAQQTIWRYNSGINGVPYSFEDFKKRTNQEIISKVDKSVRKQKEVVKRIDAGLLNIWNTSEIVGSRAGLWKN